MDHRNLFTQRVCFVLLFAVATALNKHMDHRNLFTQRVCCRRQSHLVYIGQDISGSPISVDVGMCRPNCGGAAARPPHAAGAQDLAQHASMMRGPVAAEGVKPRKTTLSSCGANHACQPTGLRVDRVLLFEGPREVEVIQECHCEIQPAQCMRVPSLRTFYSETPYESVVDVGGCSQSKEGFSCVPTKFNSALVETPNKVDMIQTVVVCELKESCYRVPYVEYYYEIVQHDDGVKEERLREVDVGRCMGRCTAGNRCLLRSPSDPEICHLWADKQSNLCVPQGYERHAFLSQHGKISAILSITSCHCPN
uniref:Pinhead n=1 Tax=Hippocampus comes TaxID=109280 RepID=A0A3Q2XCT3_HIPCM